MSQLQQKFATQKHVITAEICPPKGAGIKKLLQHAELLRGRVDAINITDCQRALVKMSSIAACKVLLENGFEPVIQLTCRDRNGIALQSDLMGAAAMGLNNLLCLTGDPVKVGDHPESKSVFETEAVGLLNIVKSLQGGRDKSGQKMNKPTKFCVGAVVNPTLHNNSNQMARMAKKVEAGAQFFQTQANYDLDDFEKFLIEARKFPVKILAGILILNDYAMAEYIHQNIPGIQVPQAVLDRFKANPESVEVGLDFAAETMRKLAPHCDGFHVMSVRTEELIPQVLDRYGK